MGGMVLNFFALSFQSIILGAIVGLLSALTLKYFNMGYNPTKECTCLLMFAYMSYLVSEQSGFSGIISMFTCGLFMAHYTYWNISSVTQKGTDMTVEVMSNVSQSFLYIYLGLSAFTIEP